MSNIQQRRRESGLSHDQSSSIENVTEIVKDAPIDLAPLASSKSFGPAIIRRIFLREKSLLMSLLLFRIMNVWLLQTTFVPDEYWQSTEVAHRLAFGYGYLTWEWKIGIRSPLYPSLFYVPFKLLASVEPILPVWIFRAMLIKIPLLIQALLTTYFGDYLLYRFSRQVAGQEVAQCCLLLHLMNWFTLYCGTRTLTNTLEMNLMCAAFYWLPWPYVSEEMTQKRVIHLSISQQWKFIFVIGLAVIIRPTAVILFLPLCVVHLYLIWKYGNRKSQYRMIATYFIVGICLLAVSATVDRFFYGDFLINQWRFLQFNVFQDIASLYGVHPWHWYFTQGLPTILLTQYPIVICALGYFTWHLIKYRHLFTACDTYHITLVTILSTIAFSVFVFSFLGHKEFRFLFPLLPLLQHVSACFLGKFGLLSSVTNKKSARAVTVTNNSSSNSCRGKTGQWKSLIIGVLILTQVLVAFYTLLIHQRGSLDAMRELHKMISRLREDERSLKRHQPWLSPHTLLSKDGGEAGSYTTVFTRHHPSLPTVPLSVMFLTPCHAFPYYSHLHYRLNVRFLTCEPPSLMNHRYVDEADTFFVDPVAWLLSEDGGALSKTKEHERPAFLILFDSLLSLHGGRGSNLTRLLMDQWNYNTCRTLFHAHFTEGFYSNKVLILCRRDVYHSLTNFDVHLEM